MQIYNIFKKYKPIIIVKRKKGKPIMALKMKKYKPQIFLIPLII
jgi:hypothetical protein